ncbi:MAG: DHH family phosphoesterase [Clostridia bacterium]|nr:DHH family phosphoesterase [Clostridia bacterium]
MKKKPGILQYGFVDILFVTIAAVVFFVAQSLICGLLNINPYICAVFLVSLYAAVVITYAFYRKGSSYRRGVKPTSEVNVVLSESVINSPSPIIVCPADKGRIVWMNKAAAAIAGNGRQVSFKDIFVATEDSSGIYEADNGRLYVREAHSSYGSDDKHYTVYTMTDVTDRIASEALLTGKQTAVAYIVVDNLEELLNYEQEDYRIASAETDRLLRQWASEAGGIIKEYQNEKYIFIFECSHLEKFSEKGFDILDKIRDIRIGENSIPLTVSIGVSSVGATPAEKEKNARSAIETALQRGGDQAVVKGEGTLDIYGGKTKMAQKRTKVKARAIANELISHITSAENVIIMFHKFADLDAFGSAIGIARLCMFCGVPFNIVCDAKDPGLAKCFGWVSNLPDYRGVFVDSATALDMVNSETLLIITDVSNKFQFESPVLYDNCNNIVIIDHHRKTAEFEKDIKITYIEPAAAAASELVCEMLEQVLPPEYLLPREADLMLAGILLDTNQFTKSTSTRTFSAALYLKGVGADVGEVQEFFKTDLEEFQRELRFHSHVEIYKGVCAIAIAIGECDIKDKIPAAKAANRLLTVEGVKASFALLTIGDDIHISARSSGTINVQLILEELRGGGHFDAAGARIEGADMEKTEKLLKAAIDKYLDETEKTKNK